VADDSLDAFAVDSVSLLGFDSRPWIILAERGIADYILIKFAPGRRACPSVWYRLYIGLLRHDDGGVACLHGGGSGVILVPISDGTNNMRQLDVLYGAATGLHTTPQLLSSHFVSIIRRGKSVSPK